MALRWSKNGAGNYAYACARVKSRKTFLLGRDTYPRMLVMDLAEIGRFIGEGQYRKEVDELSSSSAGVDLIENATYLNMARAFRDILGFTEGELHDLLGSYLARWDVWNMKTVMRGKSFGAGWDDVAENLVPAGAFDMAFFSTLFNAAGTEEMLELIMRAQPGKDTGLGKLLHGGGRPSLADIENTLDRQYYIALMGSVRGGMQADRVFRRYIATEIDIMNLKTLFKLKFDNISVEKVSELLIPGGRELPHAAMLRLAAAEGFEAFMNELAGFGLFEGIREAAGRVKDSGSLNEVLLALDRVLVGRSHQFSQLFPLSVLPVIDYLLRKKVEVDNLRAIARGKQSGLSEEEIKSLLVL